MSLRWIPTEGQNDVVGNLGSKESGGDGDGLGTRDHLLRVQQVQDMDLFGIRPDPMCASPVGAVGLPAVDGRFPTVLAAPGEENDPRIGFDRDVVPEDI